MGDKTTFIHVRQRRMIRLVADLLAISIAIAGSILCYVVAK